MEQNWFNPLHHGKSQESRRMAIWRTQPLSGSTDQPGAIGMLAETQSDGQFFRAQFNIIRREIGGEIALIVAGTAADGTFEQPLADTIFRATAQLANLA